MEPRIQLTSVQKTYLEGERKHEVLTDVDLTVQAGELVALLGPSGCGKSTLLNLIAGLDVPTDGDVRIDGQSLSDLDERARTRLRRDRVGFIFQFFNLVPTLTVEENLFLPLELAGKLNAEGRQRGHDLLEQVGLRDRASSFPDVLSGGQQQRVAIARALIHQPAVILADEPTGNLDEEAAQTVLDLLGQAVREAGVTLIMATHSRDAASIADRVLRVHLGQLETSDWSGAPAVAAAS
ncbi:MAG: ABC transporter ATP-binding protein [Acidobacteriota bacterium]